MKFSNLLISTVALLALATPTMASANQYNQCSSMSHVKQVDAANTNQVDKTWHVKKLTKYQRYLMNHAQTYYTAMDGNYQTRTAPWEGSHHLKPDANGNYTYYLNPNNSSDVNDTYQKAIDDWNNLGVINLVPTNDYNTADIVLDTNEDLGTANPRNIDLSAENTPGWGGITYLENDNSNDFVDTIMIQMTYYRQNQASAKTNFVNELVAEHEIGHALGFAHDPFQGTRYQVTYSYDYQKKQHRFVRMIDVMEDHNDDVIMNAEADDTTPMTTVEPLGQAETNALRQHYQN